MGDRCLVELTVLSEHLPRVLDILGSEKPDTSEDEADEGLTVLGFEEVNYGTLPMVAELTEAGIAWTTRWHGGDEYGPGTKHLRFAADGTVQTTEYDDTEEHVVPADRLLEVIQRPDATVDTIRTFVADHVDSMKPLSWEGQVENGKRYQALKLIGGT